MSSPSVYRPTPEDFQPRLRWYSHLWRLVVVVLTSLLVWNESFDWISENYPVLAVIDPVLGLLTLVLVHFRRRWPMTVFFVITAIGVVSPLSAGPAVLALVSVATRRVWWQVLVAAVVSFLSAQAYSWWTGPATEENGWILLGLNLAITGAVIGWAQYIGSRRELFWTLRWRAETAEAERDLRAHDARNKERARIAREMHDVLAHRISQISMHAGALTYRDDLSADDMRESLSVIETRAHEALTDLRSVLGVLRDPNAESLRPQPTYDDLPALVHDAREAGSPIAYDDQLPSPPPETVGRTIYRIVQEGVTNAAKHAPNALLNIELSGSPDAGIDIWLRNQVGFGPTSTPGSGLGLIGLAERAELRGGRLDHGVEAGQFVLHAWIPWSA